MGGGGGSIQLSVTLESKVTIWAHIFQFIEFQQQKQFFVTLGGWCHVCHIAKSYTGSVYWNVSI